MCKWFSFFVYFESHANNITSSGKYLRCCVVWMRLLECWVTLCILLHTSVWSWIKSNSKHSKSHLLYVLTSQSLIRILTKGSRLYLTNTMLYIFWWFAVLSVFVLYFLTKSQFEWKARIFQILISIIESF